MSRVDEMPTYESQSSISLLIQLVKANRPDLIKRYCGLLANHTRLNPDSLTDEYFIGYAGLAPEVYTADDLVVLGMSKKTYESACEFQGRNDQTKRYTYDFKPELFAEVLESILNHHKISRVYSDHDARAYFIWMLNTRDDLTQLVDEKMLKRASEVARSPLIMSTAYSKFSMPGVSAALKAMKINPTADSRMLRSFNAAIASERMLLSCGTKKSRRILSHNVTIDDRDEAPREWFDMSQSKCYRAFRNLSLYRFLNIWMVVIGSEMYVFDRASVDQIRTRCWSCYMFWNFAINYRCSVAKRPIANKYLLTAERAIKLYWAKVEGAKCLGLRVEALARSMKIGQARFINDAWPKNELICENAYVHSQELLASEEEAFSYGITWSGFLGSQRGMIPDDQLLDISYTFHLAPGTDANASDLFIDSIARLEDERPYDSFEKHRFMGYCHATFVMEYLCKQIKRHHKTEDVVGCIESAPGYDIASREWFKNCLKGIRDLAPEEEWGKAKLKNAFRYEKKMETAWLGASDVTHVNADLDAALGQDQPDYAYDNNEIMYTLKYGKLLSKKYDPTVWRDDVCQGKVSGDIFATIAAKSENTKYGHKIRETYSAVDTFRELQSEMDSNAQSVANIIHGPTLRSSFMSLASRMHSISTDLVPRTGSRYLHVVSSQDVSAWSPRMPRKFALEFYQMVLETSRCPAGLRYETIWSEIGVVLARRGLYAHANTKTGNFMGWPGTSDTVMHSLICAYTANRAKTEGIIEPDETATILTMIDDAILSLKVRKDSSAPHDKVQSFMKFLMGIYSKLGFEVDPVKTLVSTTKLTFLNRVFVEGREALTPMKISLKLNRELTLQFSSIFGSISGIFSAGSALSARGADPLFVYITSCFQTARLGLMTDRTLITNPISDELLGLIMLAPTMLGGWGVPHPISWLTKESKDVLSEWFGLCSSLVVALDAAYALVPRTETLTKRRVVQRLAGAIIDHPFSPSTVGQAVSNIRHLGLDGLKNIDMITTGEMINVARKHAQAAEVRAALNVQSSPAFEKALEGIAINSVLDAAVWEMLFEGLPSAVFAPVMARAKKNEIIRMSMSRSKVNALIGQIRAAEAVNLKFLPKLFSTHQGPSMRSLTLPGATYALEMRSRWFQSLKLTVLNHTDPASMDLLVHVAPAQNKKGYASVSLFNPLAPYGQGKILANIFDGRTPGRAHVGIRTKGQVDMDSPLLKTYSPLSRAFIRLGSVCTWIASHGADPSPIWQLCSRLWCTGISSNWCELGLHMDTSASSKRLSSTLSNVTHPISAFPNTQGCVSVELGALGSLLRHGHYRHDFVSIVQSMRASALIDFHLPHSDQGTRLYGANMSALMCADTQQMLVKTGDDFQMLLAKVKGIFDQGEVLSAELAETCRELSVAVFESTVDDDEDVHLTLELGGELTTGLSHLLRGPTSNTAVITVLNDPVTATAGIRTSVARSMTMNQGIADTPTLIERHTAEGAVQGLEGDPMAVYRALILCSSITSNIVGRLDRDISGGVHMNNVAARALLKYRVTPNQVQQIVGTACNILAKLPKKTVNSSTKRWVPQDVFVTLCHDKTVAPWSTVLFLLRTARKECTTPAHYLASIVRNERSSSLQNTYTVQMAKAEECFRVGEMGKGAAALVRAMTALHVRGADTSSRATVMAAWAQGVALAIRTALEHAEPEWGYLPIANFQEPGCSTREEYLEWARSAVSCLPGTWRARTMSRVERTFDENFVAATASAHIRSAHFEPLVTAEVFTPPTHTFVPNASAITLESMFSLQTLPFVRSVPVAVKAAATFAFYNSLDFPENRRRYDQLLASNSAANDYLQTVSEPPSDNPLYMLQLDMAHMGVPPVQGRTDT